MKVDRTSLEIMYKCFVQSSMEYANIVWGGSYDSDILKLENIHLDAMRLITGATARSNIINVHQEFGGYTVNDRIRQASLTMMYKIVRGMAPQYLIDILLEFNGPRHYVLRNNANLRVPYCRLETYMKSFFPRGIGLWNDLSQESKSKDTVECFKKQFVGERRELQIIYYYGKRWPSVHHARMRIGCSKLNYDLFYNLHVVDAPSCNCGAELENAEHFFLHCPLFQNIRVDMLNEIQGVVPINVDNLLFGNAEYDLELNESIFRAVHHFITESQWFV